MTKTTEQLVELAGFFSVDDEKFINGNARASTRARNTLQAIIKIAKDRRAEITAEKNRRAEEKLAAKQAG
jgi:hypothetical protein